MEWQKLLLAFLAVCFVCGNLACDSPALHPSNSFGIFRHSVILNPNYEIFHLWSYVSFFHIRLLRWECRVAMLWLKRCSGYTDLASLELQGSRVSWTTTHQDCKAECFTSSHQRRHQKHYHIATSAQPVMSMWTWEQQNKSHGYLAVRPEQVVVQIRELHACFSILEFMSWEVVK